MDNASSVEQAPAENSGRHSRRRKGNRHPAKGNDQPVGIYINPTTRLEGTLLIPTDDCGGRLDDDPSGLSVDQRVRFVLRRKSITARIRYVRDFEQGQRVGLQYEGR